jgi:hypothetical protein
MRWYDKLIYRFFHWHYCRAARETPGFAWLLKFTAEEFIERHDPKHESESSARWFYESFAKRTTDGKAK